MTEATSSGSRGFDRRQFLRLTGAAALSAALSDLLPGSFLLRAARGQDANAVVHLGSVAKGAAYAAVKEKIRAALMATRDLGVIQPGELVVIKVVSNSPYKYPMVTHPWALQAVIELVKERSTNVRVVDQVGFEHHFFTGESELNRKVEALWKAHAPKLFISRKEQVSSGLEALERNGLKGVAERLGAQVFAGDRDADYLQVPNDDPQYGEEGDPEFEHWQPWEDVEKTQHPRGYRVNKYALGWGADGSKPTRPPHVISISRLSAHVWTGTTGPTKAYYGWIHPQDRVRSHTDIDPASRSPVARDGKLVPGALPHPEVRSQSERITEVALFFQRYFERVRATTYYANLVVALDTYSDVGPDWGVVPLPQDGVVAASEDVVALDAVSSALLMDFMRSTPEAERAAPAKAEAWKVWDLLLDNDRWWNAKQERLYRATRGEWNTFFGAAPWVAQLAGQNQDPSVWNLGQVERGVQLGYAKDLQVRPLDPAARLTGSQTALLAPRTKGITDRLPGAANGGGR